MASRDILKTLKAEHDQLRALFEEMESTTDRAEKRRTELLARIESNLLPHAKWEETVFYPRFAERADRAAKNMLENLVLFTAAYIAAKGAGATGWKVIRGCQLFLVARIAYWGLYLGGITYARTAVWGVGVAGIGLLVWAALAA